MASNAYLGSIFIFAGNFAPRGFMLCQGQILPISQNTALFSILGTTYGGNGQQTFALPDLRGRAPVGQGQGPGLSQYVLGENIGVENVSILNNNMPAHNHPVNVSSSPGTQASPVNGFPAAGATTVTHPVPEFPVVASANYAPASTSQTMAAGVVGPAGGGVPISVLQPVLAINYIIAVQGIFPSRN